MSALSHRDQLAVLARLAGRELSGYPTALLSQQALEVQLTRSAIEHGATWRVIAEVTGKPGAQAAKRDAKRLTAKVSRALVPHLTSPAGDPAAVPD